MSEQTTCAELLDRIAELEEENEILTKLDSISAIAEDEDSDDDYAKDDEEL